MPSEKAFLPYKVYQAILGRFEPEHLHLAMDELYKTQFKTIRHYLP